MDLGIRGRRALVTGAGRGIGRAISRALNQEGVTVAAVSRSSSDLDQLIDEMGGGDHVGLAVDLLPDEGPDALLEGLAGFGAIDIVIHNVGGTLGITDPFCKVADWRRVFRFNFEIAAQLNEQLVPTMQHQGWGRVVHVSSISAMENHGPVTYCAAKAALTAYTRSFGGVVAPDGVVVSAILPGAVFTQGGYWEQAEKERPEHVEKFLTDRQRIGRFGKVEEIADLVCYLCSERASFNTGSIIPIDGGQGRGYFGQ
jgi:NAD(P)-dependent dehydrogenase (short-subunit alcohol dehydrogenase family)